MNAKIAFVVACTLALSACEPARMAAPIDPPVVKSSFAQAKEADAALKGWMAGDDQKALKALVELSRELSKKAFSDPQAWPDCKELSSLAKAGVGSGTVYGLSLAPGYHQQSTGMGCNLVDETWENEYRAALEDIFKDRDLDVSKEDTLMVAQYLDFLSHQGSQTCAAHYMRVAREQDKTFVDAIAGVKSDCTRPQ